MDAKKNEWTYSFTQPYNASMNPFYNLNAPEIFHVLSVAKEIKRLDEIDALVDNMLTYPDAERIMNKLREQGEGND